MSEPRLDALVDAVSGREFWARTGLPEAFPSMPPTNGKPYWVDASGRPIYEPRDEVLRRCKADRKIIEAYVAARQVSARRGICPAVLPGLLIAMDALYEAYDIKDEEKR